MGDYEGQTNAPVDIEYKEKGQIGSSSAHEGISRKLMHLSCEDPLKLGNVSLLQRVDLLDNILSTMEDKVPNTTESHITSPKTTRKHSSAPSTPSALGKRCKPAEFVLEEVEEKGTLVERVSELEKRVLKLQQILSAKSSLHDDAAVAVADVSSAHSTPPHDQVIDVEVVPAAIAQAEPAVFEIDPEKEIKNRGCKKETCSSEAAAASDQMVGQQNGKKKRSVKLKMWLSKRLHMHLPGTTGQVEA